MKKEQKKVTSRASQTRVKEELKKVLTGLSNPVTSIASGDMQIEGGSVEFLQFLSKFR